MHGGTVWNYGAKIDTMPVDPSETNGLKACSWLMIDKIMTVPRRKFGRCIGELEASYISVMNATILIYLGLAG